jgi:hypothetical protein
MRPLPDHCEKNPTAKMMKKRSVFPRVLKNAKYEAPCSEAFSIRKASLISSSSTNTMGS